MLFDEKLSDERELAATERQRVATDSVCRIQRINERAGKENKRVYNAGQLLLYVL
jgi:hypothetical protein